MKPDKYPLMDFLEFMEDLHDTRDIGSGEGGKRTV
jgi:hypothetical protein